MSTESSSPQGEIVATLTAVIDGAPWSRMFHAYGLATDTPGHLKALIGDKPDPDARSEALNHLNSAEIHQGTPWPSTATTALFVARMLGEEVVAEAEVRVALLRFLREVAEAGDLGDQAEEARAEAYSDDPEESEIVDEWLASLATAGDEEEYEELWEGDLESAETAGNRGIVDCYDAMPALLGWVAPLTVADDRAVAVAAQAAVAILARHPAADEQRGELAAAMIAKARTAVEPDERAALVLSVQELGHNPREFLADPALTVRGCAALAESLAEDPEAHDVLVEIIANPVAFDEWFAKKPDQFPMHPRYEIIAAACERVPDASRLEAGIGAVPATGNWFVAAFDFGPYLRRFFADGWPAEEAAATSGQRKFARYLAASDPLWDPTNGNRGPNLGELGLPDDREAWRVLGG